MVISGDLRSFSIHRIAQTIGERTGVLRTITQQNEYQLYCECGRLCGMMIDATPLHGKEKILQGLIQLTKQTEGDFFFSEGNAIPLWADITLSLPLESTLKHIELHQKKQTIKTTVAKNIIPAKKPPASPKKDTKKISPPAEQVSRKKTASSNNAPPKPFPPSKPLFASPPSKPLEQRKQKKPSTLIRHAQLPDTRYILLRSRKPPMTEELALFLKQAEPLLARTATISELSSSLNMKQEKVRLYLTDLIKIKKVLPVRSFEVATAKITPSPPTSKTAERSIVQRLISVFRTNKT